MIYFSDPKYSEKLEITEENILKFVNEYSIFKFCVGDFTIGKSMHSPLRKDVNPSFGIFWSKKIQGKLLFNDLSTGLKGSCFNLVMYMHNLTYMDALSYIISGFNLTDYFRITKYVECNKIGKIISNDYVPKQSDMLIQIRVREWMSHDIKFWNSFLITIPTLNKFRVYPIDYYFIGDKIFKAEHYAYAFLEQKDDIVRYKIYQPYAKPEQKWFSNFVDATISGWSQMPEKTEELTITSSLKDVMTLYECGKIAIAPQTETYSFKPHIVEILYSIASKIYIFYDYDKAGITNAYRNKKLFGFIPIFTKSTKYKDPSDYVKIIKAIGEGESSAKYKLLNLYKKE